MADTPPSQINTAPGPGGDAGRDAGGQQAQGAHAHAGAQAQAHDKSDTGVVHAAAPDLATADGVRAYLAGTAFAGAGVAPLSGGTANFVYRLALRTPHAGHATLVLKHAKGYVKDHPGMAFDVGRQVSLCVILDVFCGVRVRVLLDKGDGMDFGLCLGFLDAPGPVG